ncbi:MAG: DUF3899 domain-containing protein [Clostridia bacterium]|nr:DUF3899 domain-containing protein [Clostridia bacterium]
MTDKGIRASVSDCKSLANSGFSEGGAVTKDISEAVTPDDSKSPLRIVTSKGKVLTLFAIGVALALSFTILRAGSVAAAVAFADGLFTVSVIYLSVFSLRAVASEGALDIFGYAFSLLFLPFFSRKRKKTKGYYEYSEEKRCSRTTLGRELLYVGSGFLFPSLILSLFL